MKSTGTPAIPKEVKYPYLGMRKSKDESDYEIVSFFDEGKGVLVAKGNNCEGLDIGYYSDKWPESDFEPMEITEINLSRLFAYFLP